MTAEQRPPEAGDSSPPGEVEVQRWGLGAEKTRHAYYIEEVVSALQKAIRRGLEEEALFWAQELDVSGYGRYAFKRLNVIACEDVGLINPLCAVIIGQLWLTYEQMRKAGKDAHIDGDLLTMAVLYLARSQKNREVDDAKNHLEGRRNAGWRPPIPDEALDVHTQAGRAQKRGLRHFYEEASRLTNAGGRNRYADSPFIDRGGPLPDGGSPPSE